MRAILLDWMMEVCMEFALTRETFHYAINYTDRYLSTVPKVSKLEYQLIGVTSMYIASKMEEVLPRKAIDFAKSADNGYKVSVILKTEMKMLKVTTTQLRKHVLIV